MKALLQRVSEGSVSIQGGEKRQIKRGLVVFLGVKNGDDEKIANSLAHKIANLRIFEDQDGKFNLSAQDVNAEILVVSQFTLYADCRRGRRPSFTNAARPETSNPLYEKFVEALRQHGLHVQTGEFGAKMMVEIFNDGPVTILLDSED